MADNGTITTTSLAVAEVFGKRHCDVMRDIRRQIAGLETSGAGEWGLRNFALTPYEDSQGRPQPIYRPTRKAFDLLAMLYNDPKFVAAKARIMGILER